MSVIFCHLRLLHQYTCTGIAESLQYRAVIWIVISRHLCFGLRFLWPVGQEIHCATGVTSSVGQPHKFANHCSPFRLPLYKERIGRCCRSQLLTMNALLAVSVACLLAVSAVRAETYPAEYDNLDVDALLNNEEKMNMFAGCLSDDAVCTEKALKLKG